VRYAVGRRTYAVIDVVEVLLRHRAALKPNSREAIVHAIDEAEARGEGGLGSPDDALNWRNLREALR
jgi:hypothetical protein